MGGWGDGDYVVCYHDGGCVYMPSMGWDGCVSWGKLGGIPMSLLDGALTYETQILSCQSNNNNDTRYPNRWMHGSMARGIYHDTTLSLWTSSHIT